MAICLMVDNADETAEQFETVMEHLSESGPIPPDGASLLTAGPANGGWRVISVWDSPESLQRFFGERLAPHTKRRVFRWTACAVLPSTFTPS